jgi:FlaA1/EpsC-like NDP-sugar epimerase
MRINRYNIPEILVDIVLIAGAYALAFFLRFEFVIPLYEFDLMVTFILPVIGAKIIIFYLTGLYNSLWRYASVRDFIKVIFACILGTLAVIVIVFFIYRASPYPRSTIVLDGIFTVVLIAGIRFAARGFRELRLTSIFSPVVEPVLIAGAGDSGNTILREMLRRPELAHRPVGFIDDDARKQGLQFYGVKVLGTRKNLRELIKKHQIEEVIITMPSVSREVIRDIFFQCQEAKIKCRTLPGIYQLVDGTARVEQIREIGVEDILGREPVRVDLKKFADSISGKAVMVTGAGGSIGSELCRQISRLHPSSLIGVDHSEAGLFEIEQELLRDRGFALVATVADVTNRARMNSIFGMHRPSFIFHAAAYKHVPLMQMNTIEAIENNLLGTKILAETAIRFGAERFVFISTDKAVDPVSIMGISKALAEKLVYVLGQDVATKFMIVRFGNVLDSSGSAIPIFKRQIAAGGPVTITHPEMTRYFMTIPEAVQLVIQAGAMGKGGEIFVLDMGEQVPILEMARNMISLSGFEPEKDIPIKFTGVRAGEKLHEKLFWDGEESHPTEHERILVVKNTGFDVTGFGKDILQLEGAVSAGDIEKIQEEISRMCTHYLGMMSVGPALTSATKKENDAGDIT